MKAKLMRVQRVGSVIMFGLMIILSGGTVHPYTAKTRCWTVHSAWLGEGLSVGSMVLNGGIYVIFVLLGQTRDKLARVDMYGSRNEYDRGVNTFSPEGRLFQIEYALGAVKLGSTSIAIKTTEGLVLVTERRIQSKLMEAKADAEKLREIDTHIGCTSSGIIADARIMIDRARSEAQHHFFVYNEKIPVESCVNTVVEMTLEFSGVHENKKKSIGRPFGVALLIAGVDAVEGPSLWCVDPSGTATRYEAAAIGAAQEGAEALLQEKYSPSMTLKEAEEVALVVLRQVIEEKLTPFNIEMASIPISTQKFHVYTAQEITQVVSRLPDPATPTASNTLQSGTTE